MTKMCDVNDIASVVMDEIALEGLDGITIEGLFVRLKRRPEFALCLNDAYKQYIWNMITKMSDISMFELPEARKPLVIFNRYDYVDPELGIVLEPENIPEEIYPHAPVDDKIKGIRGSCAFYKQRINVNDVASKMTLQQVEERWGTKFVLVASQKMRNRALMGPSVDPELELAIIQYCILERIGRSRHLGEVTLGRVSLQVTGEDPKALFYHRKFLMKNGLILKQIHHQKSGNQNSSGSLLHLPRFFVERWPKVLFLTKRVIEILRSCKNCIADYEEIRQKLGLRNSLKKLFQTSYFQRFVRTDLRLPYRHLYPDAKESEWRSVNNQKEKMIRVIQLLDPNADVDSVSAKEEEFEMDDDDHGDGSNSHDFSVTINRSFLSQAYKCVESAGVNGYSQMELVQKMGLQKLSARTVTRNLLKKGVASTFMNDVGRQRVSRFRARKWDQQCTRIQTIERDIQHMRAELLSKALGAGHEVPGRPTSPASLENQTMGRGKKRSAKSLDESLKMKNTESVVEQKELDSSDSGPPSKIVKLEATELENLSDSMETDNPEHIENTGLQDPNINAPLYCSSHELQSKEALKKTLKYGSKDGPVMTYRIFKRINMILEYVKIHKVVDDHSKFLKLISEEEDREGLNMKIDKKSLLRILVRLKEDGHLKLYSYLLTDGVKVKTMLFICDKSVPQDHPAVVSAIEQAKMKLFIINRKNVNLRGSPSGTNTQGPKANPCKKQKITVLHDKTVGKKYGFNPKFVRMRTLHQFLFYLVYGFEGDVNLDQSLVRPFLESKEVVLDDTLVSELSQVYKLELNWKMFIPPLPLYTGWPEGWSIMCDILFRLPLSLFVSIFNVSYVIPGLVDYLQHPVRRHFLVRQLPVPMRNGLMAFRKYIFSIHEVMQRLCFVGLLQFGPQRLKEKDQVLIYVNRRTTLLDTITSKPGYHQISEGEYPETRYEFKTINDVERYWYNLWNICLNTQLGGRTCVQGKDIVLEQLPSKPQMQAALQPVRPSCAPALDDGSVPGDRRGAAGLDSAIFAHLKRNWNWGNISAKSEDVPTKKIDKRKIRLMNIKAAPVVFTKSAIIIKRSINYLHNGRFSTLKTEKRPHTLPPGAEVLPKKGQKKLNVVRRIEARKSRSSNKPYYDETDLKALRLMSKLRVDWSTEEDTLLLLCKVASMYLCPNPRQQTIALSEIRDILHSLIPEAKNKTSRACQRRILYMLKNLATSNNLAMNLEELRQDEDICERFGGPEENARGPRESFEEHEARIHKKFHLLVNELRGRSDRMVTASGTYCSTIPDKADDFWRLFEVVEPKTVIKSKGAFQDVKNVVDIHCSVVNTIIHSSLCTTTDKTSWAYQLFRVYQQYPDSLLRAAMGKLRQDQMVSLKKSYTRHKQKANYLPLSSSPYQLSISYLQLIQTKYQYGVYHEAYQMMKTLLKWLTETKGLQNFSISSATGGAAATVVESLCKKHFFLSAEIPEQIIILDPWISETDETYTRIVQRYKDILQTYRAGRDATTSALFRSNVCDLKEPNKNVNVIQESDESGELEAESNRNLNSGKKQETSGNDSVHEQSSSHEFSGKNETDNVSMSLKNDGKTKKIKKKEHCKESKDIKKTKSIVQNSAMSENVCSHSEVVEGESIDLDMSVDVSPSQETDIPMDYEEIDSNVSPKEKEESFTTVDNNSTIHLDNTLTSDINCLPSVENNINTLQKPTIASENLCNSPLETDSSHGSDALKQKLEENRPGNEENSIVNKKSSSTEASSVNKVDKGLPKKWERLHFEWIPDNEWDAAVDYPENVEEADESNVTDEDKLRGDFIDIPPESDEVECVSSNNTQQTIVARAASRIALFMMREETDESNQVQTKQHAHDFFVVNSCSVFCHLPPEKISEEFCNKSDDSIEKLILPLEDRKIDNVIEAIKSEAVVDLKEPSEDDVLKCLPSDYWTSMRTLLNFIETRKYLGVTTFQLREFYETIVDKKLDLATALSLLVQQKIVIRAGVSVPRYVRKKHIWPWLTHTFKFLRFEREKAVPIESQIMSCCEEEKENVMEVEVSDNKNDTEKVTEQMNDSSTEEGMVQENDAPEKAAVCEENESVEEIPVIKCSERHIHATKKLEVTTPSSFGTIVTSKDVRKASQNLSLGDKEELHVVIRPWIRINGTLNRRVLDRLLGAVLGHAMYQPGQSLHSFGRRFQPALQPVHTRELVEILQCLGCIKLLVPKQKKKVTLFSKPQPVVLVEADGTEDEQEIVVEPQPDAICRLAQFIGDKQYNQDFMAAQEQMISGHGSSDVPVKSKHHYYHVLQEDSASENLDESQKTCENISMEDN